jgi:MoaA/NifB/PqqE/SkfB family radical SAM enzyme
MLYTICARTCWTGYKAMDMKQVEACDDLRAQAEALLISLRSTLAEPAGDSVNAAHPPHPARLAKLYVEPTNECNLNCRICVRNAWQEPMGKMPEAVFTRVMEGLRHFSPPPTVFFGGLGEPLFHPEIVRMVSRAKGIGARVEMITNGTLLTADASQQLLEAGLDGLWCSLDATTPESYSDIRLGAELPRVIENIARFSDTRKAGTGPDGRGLPRKSSAELGIEFVAMRRTIAELPAALILAHKLGADRFIMTQVLPYTEDMVDEVLYLRRMRDKGYQQPDLPQSMAGDVFGEALVTAIHSMGVTLAGSDRQTPYAHCPFIGGESGAVRWDGGLSPCLPLMHDHVSHIVGRERFSRHWTIGNVKEHGLADLWNRPEHIAFRRDVMSFQFPPCTVCGGCEMAEKNEEDCRQNAFPTCGGCWWGEGAIRCP